MLEYQSRFLFVTHDAKSDSQYIPQLIDAVVHRFDSPLLRFVVIRSFPHVGVTLPITSIHHFMRIVHNAGADPLYTEEDESMSMVVASCRSL